MKQKKLGNTKRRDGKLNIWYTEKVMGMSIINGSQKQGCLMQRGQLKTIRQEFQVKIYKKRRIKLHDDEFKTTIQTRQMSSQTTNNYLTASTFPNPYITRRLNNMDKAKIMKAKRNDWTRTYYKILKELEAMIDVQKQIKDMLKIAAETNMIITEIEDSILKVSTNNQLINAMNITGILEDL